MYISKVLTLRESLFILARRSRHDKNQSGVSLEVDVALGLRAVLIQSTSTGVTILLVTSRSNSLLAADWWTERTMDMILA